MASVKGRALSFSAALAAAALAVAAAYFTPPGVPGVAKEILLVFTSPASLESAVEYMGPIASSAVGLTLAYRAGFTSIGAEGQVLLGSAAALWLLAYAWHSPPAWLGVTLSLALAAGAGAVWGLVPGLLRAYLRVNEVLSSLIMNYVALSLVNYLVSGPWRYGSFTRTRMIPDAYHVGPLEVAVAVAAVAVAVEFLRRRTRLGVAVEAHGASPRAASTYTMPRERLMVALALLSGATAGLGGGLMMLSFQRELDAMSQPPGYGYMGVLVAWLSGRSATASVIAAFLFSVLVVAGYSMRAMGVPFSFVLLIQALAVLAASLVRARRWP